MSKAASLLSCLLLFVASSGFAFKGGHKFDKKVKHNHVTLPDSQKNQPPGVQGNSAAGNIGVSTLEQILNSITFNDNTPSELEGYIKNSYTVGQRSRVFLSKDVIIENDIDPKYAQGEPHDIATDKYLNDLDLKYEKTSDFSIKFSNLILSDIKATDHIYVRVNMTKNLAASLKRTVQRTHYVRVRLP